MDENADASQAIFEPPPENWRRPPGRPRTTWMKNIHDDMCGDAFPIERVLVATYLLSVEALPHCRCGVANKSYMV